MFCLCYFNVWHQEVFIKIQRPSVRPLWYTPQPLILSHVVFHSQKLWHDSSHLFLQTMASHSPPPLRVCPCTLMVLL